VPGGLGMQEAARYGCFDGLLNYFCLESPARQPPLGPLLKQFCYSQRVKKSLRATLLFLATQFLAGGALLHSQTLPPLAPVPNKVAAIVIDPAHGGSDSGARGSAGTLESEAVVDFGRAIRVALEARGFRVILTREGNQDPSFDERSARINGLADAIFITIHISSTGIPGTVRAYFCSILPAPPPAENEPAARNPRSAPPARRPDGLLNWDRAQEPYVELSQRLAGIAQIQLAQRFRGSPEIPISAPVRQLRTVAAPAIAVEVSSIALDAAKLSQMAQPLGEALASAASTFQQALTSDSTGQETPR
jgi:N-acetylmuramoyl-L-alanine amidase